MSASGKRRTEILDNAASLFASSGLRTSLRDIAVACGILPGSLYHHFESKEALLIELVVRYYADLDAVAAEAGAGLDDTVLPDRQEFERRIVTLGEAISRCALRHRAALLLTLYEPPSGASDAFVRVAARSSGAIGKVMAETLRIGEEHQLIRPGIDLDAFADRLCQVLLHVSLGVFQGVRGAEKIPGIRCRTLLAGIAVEPPDDAALDRSPAMTAAQATIAAWAAGDDDEDERLPVLRAVARAEFGRKGYEATTVRDIAAASGMSTGGVYRLIGSKDELLASIMSSFTRTARDGWSTVLQSDATVVEKLDALIWVDINAVDCFSDEYNIQLAWMRESPPRSANLGTSFAARLKDLSTLLAEGRRAGELRLEGPNADIRAWSIFELMWMPENLVRDLGPKGALRLARETLLRGAAVGR